MELPVKNTKGEVVDTVQVSDALFGVPMNGAVVHQALVMYQLNKRQGTHSTKTRSQVSGGGRKPWPQKYTGRARQGSIRSPQWRHGGVVFGPHPRDHRVDMPRRMRHLALKCVLSEMVRCDKVTLLDDLSLDMPSTRTMREILDNLGVVSSILIVTDKPQHNVVLSARNLKRVWTLPVSLINAEQLLKRDSLIITLGAARKAEELWSAESPRRNGGRKAFRSPSLGGRELEGGGIQPHLSTSSEQAPALEIALTPGPSPTGRGVTEGRGEGLQAPFSSVGGAPTGHDNSEQAPDPLPAGEKKRDEVPNEG